MPGPPELVVPQKLNSRQRKQLFGVTYITFAILVAVTVAAFALRLHFLGHNSLWWDELASVHRSGSDWESYWTWQLNQESLNMVLYHLVLRWWLYLAESDFAIRTLSVISGGVTVIAVFILGQRLFDARTGLIAATILAVHSFHIEFSQEARGYSLLGMLCSLSTCQFVRSIERPSWRNWAGYALFSVLAGYTHFFGPLVLLAHAGSLVFLSPRAVPWQKSLVSWAVIGLLLAPLFYNALLRSIAQDLPRPEDGLYQFAILFTGNGGIPLLVVYLIPILAALVFAIRKWLSSWGSLESWRYALLFAWFLVPTLLAWAVSTFIEPTFRSIYLLGSLPALVLLTAAGISGMHLPWRIRYPLLSGAILIALVALSVRATFDYYTNGLKEDWRGTANLIASNWEPGDGFLMYRPEDHYLRHYFARLDTADPEVFPAIPLADWRKFIGVEPVPSRKEIAQFLPDEPGRIWLVLVHAGTPQSPAPLEVIAALRSKYQTEEIYPFYKLLAILFSDPKPGVFGGQWNGGFSSLMIESFDAGSGLRLNSSGSTSLKTTPVIGLVNQGLRVDYSGGGWWSVSKFLEGDRRLYQGINLAVQSNAPVNLQVLERRNSDRSAGEAWSVTLPVTERLRILSYYWSDFKRDQSSPKGNGSLDLDSIYSVRLKQGPSESGMIVTDEWTMIE
jgi:4-amino-4-deoxy-L-arabinose transferase-like glycosyltransferase